MENAKVTLSRPVTSFGEKVSSFELREPTGKEVRRIGSPLLFKEGGVDFDMERVGQYVAVLSNPPLTPAAVDDISAGDWLPLAAALAPFFMPSTPAP
ncbi:phage tail assembly protein [Xanthobacter sp. DSM 24535]|uniref:phage tail assembly protein n=1 Tax=Roseixanthobacter psychrophilus TaxID=3119917 RepID=UPI00372A8C0D